MSQGDFMMLVVPSQLEHPWSGSLSLSPSLQGVWCCHPADIFPEHADPLCSQGALWMCHLRQDLAGPCGGMEK